MIDILIQAGANVSCVDKIGRTPLHSAVVNGNLNTCQTLYKCNRLNQKAIEVLIKQNADPYLEDQNGTSSIDIAAEKGIL